MCLYVCLSVSLSVCLSISPSVCLWVWLSLSYNEVESTEKISTWTIAFFAVILIYLVKCAYCVCMYIHVYVYLSLSMNVRSFVWVYPCFCSDSLSMFSNLFFVHVIHFFDLVDTLFSFLLLNPFLHPYLILSYLILPSLTPPSLFFFSFFLFLLLVTFSPFLSSPYSSSLKSATLYQYIPFFSTAVVGCIKDRKSREKKGKVRK